MPITIPLVAADGAKSTVTVPDPVVTSGRGLVATPFRPASDNWTDPIIIDGAPWVVENANQPWSLTNPDPYTVRMEVRPGDFWADDHTARSEIATNTVKDGTIFSASWTMTVEPGVPDTRLTWLVLAQFHGTGADLPFSINLNNEHMQVGVNGGGVPSGAVLYLDPNPIQRGHPYAMQIEVRFATDATGYVKVWRDGARIATYNGIVGVGPEDQYLKLGIYEGWDVDVSQTLAVRYSHIAVDFPEPPPPPPPPPPSGLIRSFSQNAAATGTAISVPAPVGATVGDTVYVAVTVNGGANTVVDNNGSTPFALKGSDSETVDGISMFLFSRTIQAGDPSTYRFTASASDRWSATAGCFLPSTICVPPVFAHNHTVSGGSAPDITIPVANATHCVIIGVDGPSTAISTTPAGYTVQKNGGNEACAFCTKVIPAAGPTGAAAFGWGVTEGYVACSFAIS